MLCVIFLELLAMLSLAPVIDLLIHKDAAQYSGITNQLLSIFHFFSLPFNLLSLLSLFVFCHFFKVIFSILYLKCSYYVNFSVIYDLIHTTFTAIFSASWSFFSNKKGGEFVNLLQQHISKTGLTVTYLAQFFSALFQIFFFLYLPFRISWQVTLTVIIMGGLSFSFLYFFNKRVHFYSQKNILTSNQYLSFLNESLNSLKLIFSFSKQAKTIKRLLRLFSKDYKIGVRIQLLQNTAEQLYQPIGFFLVAISLLFAKNINVPLSDLTVLLYALIRVIGPFRHLSFLRLSLSNTLPFYHSIVDTQLEALTHPQPTGKHIFSSFSHSLQLSSVSFSYLSSTPVLKNVSLQINKNDMTAFVGASGEGKSTLIDLIAGFHSPQSGHIYIDNIPFSHFDIHSYRKKIGYVMQDSPLFNMSVKDNLLWANPNATQYDIDFACEQANALEFIHDLPQGFDTLLGERGLRLSGGQCQRLALARALVIQPEILILDEATSSLDSGSEKKIQASIQQLQGKMTVIVIAHRLSTIKQSDHIFVIKAGQIAESGTYQQLLTNKALFADMVAEQSF